MLRDFVIVASFNLHPIFGIPSFKLDLDMLAVLKKSLFQSLLEALLDMKVNLFTYILQDFILNPNLHPKDNVTFLKDEGVK